MREERKVLGQVGKEVEVWRREILPSPTESEPSPAPVRGGGRADKTWPQVSQLSHQSVPRQPSRHLAQQKLEQMKRKESVCWGWG